MTSKISPDVIRDQMATLTGAITQIPPMYSAVKVKGKRLYEYARAGESVDRPVRHVTIDKFELVSADYDQDKQEERVRFKVACSKGTYVRTLVVELAKRLGYPGTMSWLTRLKSGGFTLDQTLSLGDVQDAVTAGTITHYLYPLDYALRNYPAVELSADQWKAVQNGGWLKPAELSSSAAELVLKYDHQTKALYHFDDHHHAYQPTKMFSTN